MTVSEKAINRICSTDNADNTDVTEADANTVELALEINIEEVQITAADDESENESVRQRSADHFTRSTSLSSTHSATKSSTYSISPSRAHRLSPKGKENAVEVTLPDEEAESDPKTTIETEEDEEVEEENNIDDEGNKNDVDATDDTDQEEGDKQDLHPNV